MKKQLLIIFLLVALVFGCGKANKESAKQENTVIDAVVKTEWSIGEICPAGGTVFYDKGEETDGWRYLSAAPYEYEFEAPYDEDWYGLFGGDCDAIGTGKTNTKTLVDYFHQNNKQGTAALLCTELQIGGFSDWFLPSISELKEMYTNLYENGLGNFTETAYWSSSEDDWKNAKRLYFVKDNHGEVANFKETQSKVRAIRAYGYISLKE